MLGRARPAVPCRRLFNSAAERVMWRLRNNLFRRLVDQEIGAHAAARLWDSRGGQVCLGRLGVVPLWVLARFVPCFAVSCGQHIARGATQLGYMDVGALAAAVW